MIFHIHRFLDTRNRLFAGALFLMMLINSVAEALSLGLILPVLGILADPVGWRQNQYLLQAYEFSGATDANSFIIMLALGMIILFVAKNIFVGFFQFAIKVFIWDNIVRISRFFVLSYLQLPYAFHMRKDNAAMLKNITYCIPNIFYGMVQPILMVASEVFVVVSIVAILALAAPLSSLIAVAGLSVVVAIIYKLLRKRISVWGQDVTSSYETMISTVDQTLSGIKDIKVLGTEEYFVDRFGKVVTQNGQAHKYYGTAIQIPRLILETVLVGVLLSALVASIYEDATLAGMLPVLGLYGMAAMRLLPSFNRITTNMNNLDFNSAAMRDLVEDMDTFDKSQTPAKPGTEPEITFDKSLQLDDVSFTYASREGAALDGVSITIYKGQWVAFVGPSGAGKSTVANILLGLLRMSGGQLKVDGIAVDTESSHWRSRIGFIAQDSFILHDTFKQNIAFGELVDEIDEARVLQCVADAQLDSVVEHLPMGIDTVIGSSGVMLSGGEAQRLAIARALYHGADIIIMDEPTSALDTETEKAVVAAIARLAGEKTIITIAHRLSTIRHCDNIFLLEDGAVTGEGSFDDLRDSKEVFQRMVTSASDGDLEK
jgi:ATP-binding cassette, subfamily B, bacterial PglK